MVITCIVAGGTGSRMGQAVPKQFLPVLGEPVLVHTVRRFLPLSDRILIGTHPGHLEETKRMFPQENVDVVAGGATRMETVRTLFAEIKAVDDDVIVTHDGVRPFVTQRMLEESIESAREAGCSGVFVPCVDTIAVSEDGSRLDRVPRRETLYQVQTPQTFLYGVLRRLLPYAHEGLSDLCGLAAQQGQRCKMVRGEYYNIKLTNPDDLAHAEQICRRYFVPRGGAGREGAKDDADRKRI